MIGDWFNEGTEAYGHGVKADAFPYPVGTEQKTEWLAGWTEAQGLQRTDSLAPALNRKTPRRVATLKLETVK
jgi:ribosome modulation factor